MNRYFGVLSYLFVAMVIAPLHGNPVIETPVGPGGKSITAFDRVGSRQIGGYLDTEYVSMQDGVKQFVAHRYILQTSSQIHPRLLVNAEIEFEYGGKITSPDLDASGNPGSGYNQKGQLKLEQAWLDFELMDNQYLRSGIVLVPFGIVNILHDSDVRDTTQRPLYAKYVVPSTWMDTGVGVHGNFPVSEAEVNYEFYVVNGLQEYTQESESYNFATQGLRGLRPHFKGDGNHAPAVTGRVGISPYLGLEIGGSSYVGKHDDVNGITLVGLDLFYKKGPFELVSEWAKAHIDITETQLVSGLNGYYIEARYHFFPSFLSSTFLGRDLDHPTFTLFSRYGGVNLNEDDATAGKMARLTLGMNYRPTPTVVFKVEGQIGYTNGNAVKPDSGIISSVAVGF